MRDFVDTIVEQHTNTDPGFDATVFGVFARLMRVVHLLDREAKTPHGRVGLDPGETDVLMGLHRAGPPYTLTAGALLRTMLISGGTLTSRVDRLVAKGLVSREVDPDNRRSVLITLTEDGLQRGERMLAAHLDWCRLRFSSLSGEQQEQLSTMLRTLLVSLGDSQSGPAELAAAANSGSAGPAG